jgi:hypothetical protein
MLNPMHSRHAVASLASYVSLALAVAGCGSGTSVPTNTVDGTITGLGSKRLILQNNGGDDVTITASGPYRFSSEVPTGGAYSATTAESPSLQRCALTNARVRVSTLKSGFVHHDAIRVRGELARDVRTGSRAIQKVGRALLRNGPTSELAAVRRVRRCSVRP